MVDYNAGRRFIKARNSWLVGHLPYRGQTIRGIFVHATRSGHSAGDDGPGTENWFGHPANGTVANGGAMADMIIYESGQQVQCIHWELDEQPLWAGGWGGSETWNAQQFYIHVEMAQGTIDDPFTPEQMESLAQFTAEMARRYAFVVQRILFLSQVGKAPDGICDHEHSANGVKLGKSDPGPLFPWSDFIARANTLLQPEEEPMTPAERAEIDARFKAMDAEILSLKNSRYQLGVAALGVEHAPDGRFIGVEQDGVKPPLDAYPTENLFGIVGDQPDDGIYQLTKVH